MRPVLSWVILFSEECGGLSLWWEVCVCVCVCVCGGAGGGYCLFMSLV